MNALLLAVLLAATLLPALAGGQITVGPTSADAAEVGTAALPGDAQRAEADLISRRYDLAVAERDAARAGNSAVAADARALKGRVEELLTELRRYGRRRSVGRQRPTVVSPRVTVVMPPDPRLDQVVQAVNVLTAEVRALSLRVAQPAALPLAPPSAVPAPLPPATPALPVTGAVSPGGGTMSANSWLLLAAIVCIGLPLAVNGGLAWRRSMDAAARNAEVAGNRAGFTALTNTVVGVLANARPEFVAGQANAEVSGRSDTVGQGSAGFRVTGPLR